MGADDVARRLHLESDLRLRCEVRLAWDAFGPDGPDLAEIYRPLGRCVAVVDEYVAGLYREPIEAYFCRHGIDLHLVVQRSLEADKTLRTVERLLDSLGPGGCDVSRNEPVLVIGGGVLGDTAGLTCALLNRRTPYIMVATSLVSAVDAGPSPRTCVNTGGFKNSVGAFHPPILTLVDRSLFRTQPQDAFRHGLAEALKMAIVDDSALFGLITEHGEDLVTSRLAGHPGEGLGEVHDDIVYQTLRSYLRHEGTNMFEIYQDRPHAFGHTWSPVFEMAAGLRHGHAVSIEMAFSSTMACLLGWIDEATRDRILDACQRLGLAIHHPVINDIDLLIAGQQSMRAKRGGRALWVPLPTAIGQCDYLAEVEASLLRKTVESHHALCQTRAGSSGIGASLAALT